MAPVGPWAQPKATRREGGRRAERPVGSYATPDTPCSRTAPKGLPQTEAWAERERVPSGHNCRRQLATGRPEQIQEPGTAVPGTPIFANNAQRGGPPLESPCRGLSLVLSFASKESTAPSGRQPDHPRRSRRVMLQPRQGVCAYRRTKGLSVRLLETFGHRSWRKTHRTVSLSPRRSRRLPRRGFLYGKASARRHKHGTSSE